MANGDNSTDIWKYDWFKKYEKRHEELEMVTLTQFVANYSVRSDGSYKKEKHCIILYRNYGMGQDLIYYKRMMISLHYPFCNEDAEIQAEFKFVTIYHENENSIFDRRKKFESNLDI